MSTLATRKTFSARDFAISSDCYSIINATRLFKSMSPQNVNVNMRCSWRYCINVTLFCVILAAIYTSVNVTLVNAFKVCTYNEINTLVRAKIISNMDGNVTYRIDNNQTSICSIIYTGSNREFHVNETVFIYKSNSGLCDVHSNDNTCADGLISFNVIFTLFGIPLIYNLVECMNKAFFMSRHFFARENSDGKIPEIIV
jgi:hypothetical protein